MIEISLRGIIGESKTDREFKSPLQEVALRRFYVAGGLRTVDTGCSRFKNM